MGVIIATTFGGVLTWSLVSQFEVTEGIVAVAALLPLALLLESQDVGSRLDSNAPRELLRSRLSPVFASLGAGGMLAFCVLVLCNLRKLSRVIDASGVNVVQYPLSLLAFLGGSALGQGGTLGYGALALATWGLTIGALCIPLGIARTVKFFALPSILFLTAVVLLFDPGQMDSQAVNLVSGFTFDGMSLLSNWSLLTVSLFFTAFGLMHKRLGLSGLTRVARTGPQVGKSLASSGGDGATRHSSEKK